MATDPSPTQSDAGTDPAHAPTLAPGEGGGAATAPAAGRVVGDYELLDEIARGGMGVVYKARQISLNRVVALKMILTGQFASPTAVLRFKQEAEAAAGLDHANILPVYDVGTHGGYPYFTMKLVSGGSLADRMADLARDPRAAAGLLEAVARGVHYAHQRGILHRDLKPANLLLDTRHETRDATEHPSSLASRVSCLVSDFGLAKRTGDDSSLTQSGAVMGTPSYMAPEQARGDRALTTAADVYALGAILYEMLTGRPPFRGESVAQTLRMVEEQDPVPPRTLNPACDRDLSAVALKCLEKEPARRYESAGALADDLSRWLRREPVTARRAGPARRLTKWVRRNPAVAALTVGLAAALVAGTVVSAWYAVKARANERTADERSVQAKAAEERATDALARGQFEQARALRLAGRPGWRDRSLALTAGTAALLARPRDFDLPTDLPSTAELRGEAVMALIARDAVPVRELPSGMMVITHFSPDGRRMIQLQPDAENQYELHLTDLMTGAETGRRTLTPLEKPENLAFLQIRDISADGTRVLCRGLAQALEIRDVAAGTLVAELSDSTGGVFLSHRALFSRDGRQVAAVRDAGDSVELVVWQVAKPTDARVVARRPAVKAKKGNPFDHTATFTAMGFSPDGGRLCYGTADSKTVRVLDLTADPPAAVEFTAPGVVRAAAWHPAAPLLALLVEAGDGRARAVLWDLPGNRVRATLGPDLASADRFETPVLAVGVSLAFRADGRRLAVSTPAETTVRVFATEDGAELFRLPDAGLIGVGRALWTAAGDLVTVGLMDAIRVWRLADDTAAESYAVAAPSARPAFTRDGRRLAVLCQPAPQGPRPPLLEEDAASPSRVAVIDRAVGQVRVFDSGLAAALPGLAFAPDGARLLLGDQYVVRTIDPATGAEDRRWSLPADRAGDRWRGAFYAPDGRPFAIREVAGKPNRLPHVWDLAADRSHFSPPVTQVTEALVTPGGDRLLVSPVKSIRMPGRPPPERGPERLYALPGGKELAAFHLADVPDEGFADHIRLDAAGGRLLSMEATNLMTVSSVNGFTRVVRAVPSGEVLLRVPNRTSAEHAHDFGPDGRFLVVGSDHGFAEVWDVSAGGMLFRWQPHGGKTVVGIAVSSAGDIATASADDDRVCVLKWDAVRERLAERGLGW